MRRAGVIGWPVAHSRSPLIHGYWLERYNIAGRYDKLPVAPEDFAAFVRAMPGQGFVGANVTIPHKGAACRLCDELTPRAGRLESVNTLWFENGRILGDSTDGEGFVAALDLECVGWDERRRRAVVLGAGGAAAPIVDALRTRGFEDIVVANRTVEKAEDLARRLSCRFAALDRVDDWLEGCDLLVNTTSLGMKGEGAFTFDLHRLPPYAVVDDIVYVPLVTPLLAAAQARGLRTVGGLGMLLHQATPGFQKWFGIKPEVTRELYDRIAADVTGAVPAAS